MVVGVEADHTGLPISIEGLSVAPGLLMQAGKIVDDDIRPADGDQTVLTQRPQHPVHVNGGQADRIRQLLLFHRAPEGIALDQADTPEPMVEFGKQVRDSCAGIPAPNADESFAKPLHLVVAEPIQRMSEKRQVPVRQTLSSIARPRTTTRMP